jgi:hypothetical protein
MVLKKCQSENCARFLPNIHPEPRWQIFHARHQWGYRSHWTCRVHNFYHLWSNLRLLAGAPRRTVKEFNVLHCTQHGSIQIDHESSGTPGMTSFIPEANENGCDWFNQCYCLHWWYPAAFEKPF